MSDNNNTKTMEKAVTEIESTAYAIAEDSDGMRKNLEAIADALQPSIDRAGVRFGSLNDSQMWKEGAEPNIRTVRIGIKRYDGGIRLGVEETQYDPETWDGSNWIGHPNPFSANAYARNAAMIVPFSHTSRRTVECIIERLPEFILEYCGELMATHKKYADLREKAELIQLVLEDKLEA